MSLWGPYDVYLAKVTLVSVPEPQSVAMFGVALAAFGMATLRRTPCHPVWVLVSGQLGGIAMYVRLSIDA
ncbi:PEP-CTERM sorting domain-containing protein [Bythopirellula polymerisocia]